MRSCVAAWAPRSSFSYFHAVSLHIRVTMKIVNMSRLYYDYCYYYYYYYCYHNHRDTKDREREREREGASF